MSIFETISREPSKSNLFSWGSGLASGNGLGTQAYEIANYPIPIGLDNGWQTISAKESHCLGIKDGKLYAWGYNAYGQLGDGTTTYRGGPVQIGSYSDWTAVSAGFLNSLGIRDGKLYQWGDRNGKQSPFQIGTNSDWTDISAGYSLFFGIRQNRLYQWGTSNFIPTQLTSISTWQKIDSSWDHYLGIAGGKLYSWGWNNIGQLGRNVSLFDFIPGQIGTESDWTYISANGQNLRLGSSYAIRDGKLYAWGQNSFGQLGIGNTTNQSTPQQVGSNSDWTKIAAGPRQAIGIRNNNIFTWGEIPTLLAGGGGGGMFSTVTNPTFFNSDYNWTHIASNNAFYALHQFNI